MGWDGFTDAHDHDRHYEIYESWRKWGRVAYRASANVALLQFPEPIAIRARLVHLTEGDVHEVVAVDKMAVERFAVFQFYKLGIMCQDLLRGGGDGR